MWGHAKEVRLMLDWWSRSRSLWLNFSIGGWEWKSLWLQVWDYRLTYENHDRYYLNRVCILETQSLWSNERSLMSSEDLKDWKEEVSIDILDPRSTLPLSQIPNNLPDITSTNLFLNTSPVYIYLTHSSFLLWPSSLPNPHWNPYLDPMPKTA